MTTPALLTIADAAAMMGVPKRSLQGAAEKHGYLIRMGRAIRISADQLPELLKKCQNAPKAPASTGTEPVPNGSSETLADQKQRQAQLTAQRLKRASHNTSPPATRPLGRVIPLK